MAKGKGGKSKGFVSQGVHSNVARGTRQAMRAASDVKSPLNKLKAYLDGKDPWITIENPNKAETNRRFIKVKASQHYGPLKERKEYVMGAK